MKYSKTEFSPPWVVYANQVEAMFKKDPDIKFEYDNEENIITLRVNGIDKADALMQLLPAERNFGGVVVTIRVISANKGERKIDLFLRAFEGNPIFSETISTETPWGPIDFVMFNPEIVQYNNDDMFDWNGIKTTVYQDLAKEIFGNNGEIHFCTEKIIN